nr:CheR family methyltransferase [Bowmanella yangjiangensis]
MADFEQVRKLLYQLTRIHLADSKDSMVYSRLVRRLRALKIPGFKQYLQYVQSHEDEVQHFINALTTNLTAFFRESHHFDLLSDYLRRHSVKRIWCAASSTGEEPYSIAMTVAETFGRFDAGIEIIASDIDSGALQTAQAGIYAEERIKSITNEQRKQFFLKGKGAQLGKVKVVPELARMVSFRKVNLTDKKWDIDGPLDVIFCRNVMIYFDKPTQMEILQRMISLLKPDGIYIAGHSENFSHATHLVKPLGKTAYLPVRMQSA